MKTKIIVNILNKVDYVEYSMSFIRKIKTYLQDLQPTSQIGENKLILDVLNVKKNKM